MESKKFFSLLATFAVIFSFSSQAVFAQVNSVSVVNDPIFKSAETSLLLSIGTLYSDNVKFGEYKESASSLQSKDASSAIIKNPFTLKWQTIDEYTTYPTTFKKQYNYVEIRTSKFCPSLECGTFGWSKTDLDKWVGDNCFDFNGDNVKSYSVQKTGDVVWQMTCAGNGGVAGTVKNIESPRPYWKTEFQFNNGKETITSTISNNGEGALTKTIEDKVHIRFSGLSGLTYPRIATDVRLWEPFDSGSYFVVDNDKFNVVDTALADDAQELVRAVYKNERSKSSAEGYVRNAIGQLSAWTSKSDFPRASVTKSGSELKLILDEKFTFQNFVVYLAGNWIELVVPQGKPEIVSPTRDFTDLEATKTGTIAADIKNVGTDTASFSVALTCGSSNAFTKTQIVSNVAAGSSKHVSFQINSNEVDVKTDDSCTMTACDSTNEKVCDSQKYDFSIVPRPTCSNGEQIQTFTGGKWTAYECVDGKFSKTVVSCEAGQVTTTDLFGKFNGCKDENQASCSNGATDYPVCTTCKAGFEMKGGLFGIGGTCQQKEKSPWDDIDTNLLTIVLVVAALGIAGAAVYMRYKK